MTGGQWPKSEMRKHVGNSSGTELPMTYEYVQLSQISNLVWKSLKYNNFGDT